MKTGREFLETHQNNRKADDWSSGAAVDGYTDFPDVTGVGGIGIRGTSECNEPGQSTS